MPAENLFSWNEVLTVLRALSARLCWEWSFAGKHVSPGEAQGGRHRAPAPLPHRQTPHQVPAALLCSNQNLLNCKKPHRFIFLPPEILSALPSIPPRLWLDIPQWGQHHGDMSPSHITQQLWGQHS